MFQRCCCRSVWRWLDKRLRIEGSYHWAGNCSFVGSCMFCWFPCRLCCLSCKVSGTTLRRRRNVRSSRKFPSFTATRPQHQRRTLQRRRTSHHQHHAERHRKHKEGNLPYLQPQRTTYHHRSKQKDYQLPRRHFQPKQQHLPALHKA